MKRMFMLVLFCGLCTLWSMAQRGSVFEELAGQKGVSTVYISEAMFRMMGGLTATDLELGPYISKIKNLQIISCENKELVPKVKAAFRNISTKNGYEVLMRVTDEGEKTVIYWRERKGENSEFVLLTDETDEFTAIVIEGTLTLAEMQQIMENSHKKER